MRSTPRRIAGAKRFDEVAAQYDRARPSYPAEIIDALFELTGAGPHSQVLEVGAGTGKASRDVAPRVGRLVCLEPGPCMAAMTRSLLGGAGEVIESRFEDYETDERFDVVFSATAWHWVDPAVAYQKAWELLKPGGFLAILIYVHAFPEGFDSFFEEMQGAYDAIREPDEGRFKWPPPKPEERPDGLEPIVESGLFDAAGSRRVVWEIEYTAEEFVELLGTFSDHLAMPPEKMAVLYAEVRRLAANRRILKHYLATLAVGRRIEADRATGTLSS